MSDTQIEQSGGKLKLKANPGAPISILRGYDRAATVAAANAANSVPALRAQVAELAEMVGRLVEEVEKLKGNG